VPYSSNIFCCVILFVLTYKKAQRYHVGQIFSYKGLSGIDGKGNTELEVNFMLPEYEKLAGESYLHHILSLGFRLWYAYGCFSQLT